jgi:hypothetical protein
MRCAFIALLVLLACGTPRPAFDGGAGPADAGERFDAGAGELPDAGARLDAGAAADAGMTLDAGSTDAGAPDAGTPDAGIPDAGVADAGVPDAGAPDAGGLADAGASQGDGGFYGAVKCPNANDIVCDDFEGSTIDPQWSQVLSNGYLSIDATMAARGSHALHAVTTPNGGSALLSLKTPIALSGDRLWGRMFVYVPSRLEAMLTNHTNIATASGRNAVGANATYGVWFGNGLLGSLFWEDNPPIDTSGLGLQSHVPTDRWFCVEWDFNGVAKQLNVYLDGQLIPMSTLDGYDPPLNATLSVGLQFALEEAWFDSVAFARTRIGCGG